MLRQFRDRPAQDTLDAIMIKELFRTAWHLTSCCVFSVVGFTRLVGGASRPPQLGAKLVGWHWVWGWAFWGSGVGLFGEVGMWVSRAAASESAKLEVAACGPKDVAASITACACWHQLRRVFCCGCLSLKV